MYAAIADQLSLLGVIPPAQANFAIIREAAANYIYTHPNDFLPFLPSVLGEDGLGTSQAGIMGPREFEAYCATIRDTATWGGEPEILALSKAYGISIHVVQGGSPPVVVHDPTGAPRTDNLKDQKAVRVSYHRRMYGLGEVSPAFHVSTLCISWTMVTALQLTETKGRTTSNHQSDQEFPPMTLI